MEVELPSGVAGARDEEPGSFVGVTAEDANPVGRINRGVSGLLPDGADMGWLTEGVTSDAVIGGRVREMNARARGRVLLGLLTGTRRNGLGGLEGGWSAIKDRKKKDGEEDDELTGRTRINRHGEKGRYES